MGHPPTDDDGFVVWADIRRRMLRRTAYLICGDWDRAEDLTQEALARLFVHWRRASRADELDAYVRRTLVNVYLADQRRPWRRATVTDQIPDSVVPGPEPSARGPLLRALADLGPSQRTAIVLRYWEDLSVEATAAAMNCSTGNVKSQCARGLTRLREVLREEELS